MITKHGIREAYYNTFLLFAKKELLDKTDYYELDDELPLPDCMLWNSFQDALKMEEYNTSFRYLKTCRMFDVKGYIKNRNSSESYKKRFGEDYEDE